MKLSKYTFLFPLEEEYYIYNTLSNALLSIDQDSYNTLKQNQSERSIVKENDIDTELYDLLSEKLFISENDKDDFLVYKSMIDSQRNNLSHMHLTIAPTMDCNFSCHYCFEKKEKKYITSEVIDSLIKYIEQQKDLSSILLTWFGGEPLMAIDKIQEFYNKFQKIWGEKEFSANIITTAYHITPEIIEVLKEVKISSMQITLDGNKETHNKIKQTTGCSDVFSKVIQNIDLLTELAPEIHITIRVNLTRENIKEYVELYKFLLGRYKGKNIGIAPGFVNNRGHNSDKKSPLFLSLKECSEYVLDLFYNHGIHSPAIQYPDRFFNECAIRNRTSMGVDPEGYVYKCWEIIGNKKYAIGRLSDGQIDYTNITILNRQLYGADTLEDKTCSQCRYLPLCNGGCPLQRIENVFEGATNKVCTHYKGYLPEFLKAHIKLKKAGFANNR
ncbi:MAG: SPASM domain-containing protein [Dysgonamonadaceae bacterium]|jgi:uncharacterized protein|nr:SPASM domain-containing protein [Dysgonamonadaceae bacterium]